MKMSPAVIDSKPAIIRSSVDLPQPDAPTSTTNSPFAMSRSIPRITETSPNRLSTLRTLTEAMVTPRPPGSSLRERSAETRLALVLLEDVLDLLRGEIQRLAGAHLADDRLVQAQAQHLLDLRPFLIAQLLLRGLERFEIGGHPAIRRVLREVGGEHVRAIRNPAGLRERILGIVAHEP